MVGHGHVDTVSNGVAPREWWVLISGFRQSRGEATGLQKLYMKLVDIRTASTPMFMEHWNSRFDQLAQLIWRSSVDDDIRPVIRVAAYSWGCGHGFVEFANALNERGLSVNTAVLCDPVFHQWWRPHRAMIPVSWASLRKPIEVPGNVGEVFSVYQRQNLPSGHDLVGSDPRTKIHDPVEIVTTHQFADDNREFHDLTLRVFLGGKS